MARCRSSRRRGLSANWALLERTGTSTNVLSKAAHDLAVRPLHAPVRGIGAPTEAELSYLVGGTPFPSATVDEHDLRAVLEPEFDCAIEVREVPGHARLGSSGIVLATATRRRPASAPARG